MEELLRLLRMFAPAELATEGSACDALARARWPNGLPSCPRCGAPCTRDEARITCARSRPHRMTVLVGTPFQGKRRARVRALLLGIRAFALTPRGISARELAREIGMSHVTLWRHLHTLRALLPGPIAHPSSTAAAATICRRDRAFACVGARVAIQAARSAPRAPGRAERLVAETVRTKINGTHHGVSARWLTRYLDEASLRWRMRDAVLDLLSAPLVTGGAPLAFDAVRPFTTPRAPRRPPSGWARR